MWLQNNAVLVTNLGVCRNQFSISSCKVELSQVDFLFVQLICFFPHCFLKTSNTASSNWAIKLTMCFLSPPTTPSPQILQRIFQYRLLVIEDGGRGQQIASPNLLPLLFLLTSSHSSMLCQLVAIWGERQSMEASLQTNSTALFGLEEAPQHSFSSNWMEY